MKQEIKNFRESYLILLNTAITGVRRSVDQKDFETADTLISALNTMFYHTGFQMKDLLTDEEVDSVQDKINAIERYVEEMKP